VPTDGGDGLESFTVTPLLKKSAVEEPKDETPWQQNFVTTL
jgi:hypothetical protein